MLATTSTYVRRFAKVRMILALAVVFVAFEAATIPFLRRAPGGTTEPLDAQFFYTADRAFASLGPYAAAKRFWIGAYLTWDTVNPVLYASILVLLVAFLFERAFGPESRMQRLNMLPLVAGVFDLLENISIVSLLAAYPRQLDVVAWLSTAFTMGKMCFLGASVVLVVLGVGRVVIKRLGHE